MLSQRLRAEVRRNMLHTPLVLTIEAMGERTGRWG
jgi:hypothetical protein